MKPGGQYKKGAARERQRVRWHMANGAVWAARTAGSHGAIDVAALYPLAPRPSEYPPLAAGLVLEQIKCGDAKPTREELIALRLIGAVEGVVVAVVLWPDRCEPRAVVLGKP